MNGRDGESRMMWMATLATLAALGALACGAMASSSITLRGSVESRGGAVTLGEVAELAGEEAMALGGVVVAELGPGQGRVTLSIEDVRRLLSDRGVHWGKVSCRGASTITISRINGGESRVSVRGGARVSAAAPSRDAAANPAGPVTAEGGVAVSGPTLREQLVAWLGEQLEVSAEQLRVSFEGDAEALDRALSGERLEIEPQSLSLVGRVTIVVRRYREGQLMGTERVAARVQVLREVLVARGTLSRGQAITEADIERKGVWFDSSIKRPLTSAADAVGQRAGTSIRSGGVIYLDDVRGESVVKRGQLVTVRCVSGGVVLRTVARAVDEGEIGSTIAVRNERTREVYSVQVTGPQEATLVLGEGQATAMAEEGRR